MTDVTKLNKLIEAIMAIEAKERLRYINTALTFLGDATIPTSDNPAASAGNPSGGGAAVNQPTSVADRMKKNGIPADQIEHVFQFHDDGTFGIIAVPGRSNKQRAINTYMLHGLGAYLSTGKLDFLDIDARAACKQHGCYDQSNHSGTLKQRPPAFIPRGDDWSMTIPGIKDAVALVKEVADAAAKS